MTDLTSEEMSTISQIQRMPPGVARCEVARLAVERAEANQPFTQAYPILVTLQVDSHLSAHEEDRILVPFVKLGHCRDEHPEIFTPGNEAVFLRMYMPVVDALMAHPHVPAEQIDEVISEMERRFAIAGFGTQLVWLVHFLWATMRGADEQEVERFYTAWVQAVDDECAPCSACALATQGSHYIAIDDVDRGVSFLEQSLELEHECSAGHQQALCALASVYLELGDGEKARSAAVRVMAALADGRHEVVAASAFGSMVLFLARTNHHDRALRLLVAHQRLLAPGVLTPFGRCRIASQIGGALNILTAAGRGDEPIVLDVTGATTISALAGQFSAEATELGELFDTRNQTTRTGSNVAEKLGVGPSETVVDLTFAGTMARGEAKAASRAGVGADGVAAEAHGDETRSDGVGAGTASVTSESADKTPDALAMRREAMFLASMDPSEASRLFEAASLEFESRGLISDAADVSLRSARSAENSGEVERALELFRKAEVLFGASGADTVEALPTWLGSARAYSSLGREADADRVLGTADATLRGSLEQAPVQNQVELAVSPQAPSSAHDGHPADPARERKLHAAILELQDFRARLAATHGRYDEAAARAEECAIAQANSGALTDAAHSFLLLGRIRRDHLGAEQREGAIWAFESAMEGFAMAHQRDWQVKAANQLIPLLREAGRLHDAEAVASGLLRAGGNVEKNPPPIESS